MAIAITANLAKKVPISDTDFSSLHASISITAEVTDLNQVVAEAKRLYALAEQAVDAQLAANMHAVHQPPAAPQATPTATATQAMPAQPRASRPYPNTTRRAPAPITDSQLRFLDRLIRETGTDPNTILQQHQIGSLRDLSCKAASQLLDELRSAGARS
jgi:hypothetical protein